MKVVLEKEDVYKLMHSAFCNGGLTELAYSGVRMKSVKEHYELAKSLLNKESVCREDVWLKVLETKGVTFVDEEGDEEIHITLNQALENLQEAIDTDLTNSRLDYIMQSLKEDGDDAFTHWYILQMALYKDIIFG